MKGKILIVEDEYIVANDLRMMLLKAGYEVCGVADSVSEAVKMIDKTSPDWVLLDIFLVDGSKGIDVARYLNQKNIGFIYVSANTNQTVLEAAKATRPAGFLVKPFREKDLLIMLDIAKDKHHNQLRFEMQRELIIQKQFQNIRDLPCETCHKIAKLPGVLQTMVPFDYMRFAFCSKRNSPMEEYHFIRTGFDEYQNLTGSEFVRQVSSSGNSSRGRLKVPVSTQSGFLNDHAFRQSLMDDVWEKQVSAHYGLAAKLNFITYADAGDPVLLTFYSKNAHEYSGTHVSGLEKIKKALLWSLEFKQPEKSTTASAKAGPVQLPMAPETTDKSAGVFNGIIGNSPALLKMLDEIDLVARSNIAVLILGESGTGKEKVARSIHALSSRKANPIITINCAAIPQNLIESELFGHEKGAFTGAVERRIGKFEMADGGTVFLDEIGELTMESQVKLLRVLQEQEFERIGSWKTIKVNVRIVAATNRNLEKEVAEGRFRLDLYYRLNVFPIQLAPLRERKGDIPLLCQHFLALKSEKMGKQVTGIADRVLKQLDSYDWPGNIRELEHLIERSMLLADGTVIDRITLPLPLGQALSASGGHQKRPVMRTLDDMEADYILDVLSQCQGKIAGRGGAAEILGLPSSTLNSKMKKLGITKYFNK
ncbi:DNA-binding NtrC family response regulator [Mucilaginibacter rubeus]|uniref:sigma 54-interacting response regulator n=1 Tax=Mucilaginibacter rubeus TaxID=2027860 RepID=UPI0033981E44